MQTSENPKLNVMHALPRDHHSATRILAFLHVHMHACVYFWFSINGLHLGMRSRQGQSSMAGHQGVLPCPVHVVQNLRNLENKIQQSLRISKYFPENRSVVRRSSPEQPHRNCLFLDMCWA